MRQRIFLWIEDYLFYPNTFQRIISFFLLPFSLIYLIIILLRRGFSRPISFNVPVISIGNLIVGGSGKTPLTIALAKNYENVCVILRGYGRQSKGLFIISRNGKILEDIKTSGDEAMLLAKTLSRATIIVSENRVDAIKKAQELGCKIVFLDDGFSKYNINKFDILIRPKDEPTNIFCLPSGGYREPKMFYTFAQIQLQEGKGFKRFVSYSLNEKRVNVLPHKLLLLTAISKPKRLLDYLPKNVKMEAFEDHHIFTKDDIDKIKNEYAEYAIITTRKDFVKLQQFDLEDIYLMDLELEIDYEKVDFKPLDDYINSYKG
ncbi:tetraacyldisaccharide 4'-kinase [Malaciobacter molluscorum LMG 25693]|uniref:Tetraacyldisaccharide 4'-kinase n=1 Tax=Malaciobacter molluscorum LMG 25693 TaxID=870501 RepID=A0A2G1DKD1_9BACT|nr:tetraacyldisaccharide 4'-kinase [Malaciobacter molluscorum]AXX92550.1 tetraacyldisaccharide 4'-kinase [Malaciobacter molluscorum LMG 25693]PHO18975.1 tetraacyldisaccharide 4'-kinase [Malaciobacter molluscorum LMG 25693]RXJ97279.1 tetraacyldisaccharide 4'-kinase [Malaciobacter molluscorum]